MSLASEVLVVIGAGGMGRAIARRQGPGKTVLLADFNEDTLAAAADAARAEGHHVVTHRVDVSSRESVSALAREAASLGSVTQVVHTAGLSPAQAPTSAVLAVDLLGVALVLEEFGDVIAAGGAGVVIASVAGHLAPPLSAEQQRALAGTPADQLLDLPLVAQVTDAGLAYAVAKQCNLVRVQAASIAWGKRGARVNSISPGVICTPMAEQEMSSSTGDMLRPVIAASPAGRLGTPDDIAAAAAFLLGAESSFITGTDVLVDGGVVATLRCGDLSLEPAGS